MANSWNGPKLGSPIRTDVPELQKKLIALLKQDPTSVANIPSGAKRLVNTSGTKWQVQQYNGSRWAAIGKLMHDVDKLDGYHAAITPNANTVAVRNADKQLEGDITGNAATASSATTLSETLPVNKGGTGATTSAQARTNLGVPPTSHASSNTTYGLGSNDNYGHVRGDGVTTNVVTGEVVTKDVAIGGNSSDLASARGVFTAKSMSALDYNTLTEQGIYAVPATDSTNGPGFAAKVLVYAVKGSAVVTQIAINVGGFDIRWRYRNNLNEWSEWKRFILETNLATSSTPGIVKPGTGMTVNAAGELNVNTASTSKAGIVQLNNTVKSTSTTQAATANAVKAAYDKAVNAESAIKKALPVGALLPSFASKMSGYLLCNGAAVSRTTYADLFALLGTSFGTGDGSTTFKLPDFRNKTLWGASKNLMKVIAAGLPNITGNVFPITYTGASDGTPIGGDGAFNTVTDRSNIAIGKADYFGTGYYPYANFNASRSSTIYGKSTTVQPPAIAANIFIKY